MGSGTKTALPGGLYAIVDSAYVAPDKMPEVARAVIGGGARVVQLRAKGLGAAATLKAARAVKAEAEKNGVVFIVNDRVDVAVLSKADGVHLGQEDIPAAEARRLLGPGAVIGVSTHNVGEARKAFADGADYVAFGPVFPTRTKGDADVTKGVQALEHFRKEVHGPVVAIGGITEENIAGVVRAGADLAAVISDILLAPDPYAKAASISRIFKDRPKGGPA